LGGMVEFVGMVWLWFAGSVSSAAGQATTTMRRQCELAKVVIIVWVVGSVDAWRPKQEM